MTPSRLLVVAAISALLVLAMACGSDLSGDSGGASTEADVIPASLDRDDGSLEGISEEGRGSVIADFAYDDNALGEASPPADLQLGGLLDRKIIQSTSIDLEIEGENGVSRSFQDIIRIAETTGGFVANSSFSNIDDRQFGDVTIRVPGDQYQSVLADIRGMGVVTQEGSDANDVSEEYTDLQARLRTLDATEQRYLELLAQAGTINEILVVQDRLDVVRGQIEQVVGRVNLLDNLTDLATITAHLSPAALAVGAAGEGGSLTPAEAFENAWEASLTVLSGIAIAAVVVVAFSWWLVPVVALLAIGARIWANRRPKTAIVNSAT
jgi:hypothetical protein